MYSNFVNLSPASTTEIMAAASGIFSDFSGYIFLILGVLLVFLVIEAFITIIGSARQEREFKETWFEKDANLNEKDRAYYRKKVK